MLLGSMFGAQLIVMSCWWPTGMKLGARARHVLYILPTLHCAAPMLFTAALMDFEKAPPRVPPAIAAPCCESLQPQIETALCPRQMDLVKSKSVPEWQQSMMMSFWPALMCA